MFKRHCTDEVLLSLLDEGHDRQLIVSQHVQSCWKCRSRLSSLKDQIQSLSSAWEQARLNPSEDVERARKRFLARISVGAFEFGGRGWWPIRSAALLKAPLTAGLGAILLLGGVTVWELRKSEKPETPPVTQPPISSARRVVVPVDLPRQAVPEVPRLEHPAVEVEPPVIEPTRPSEAQLVATEVEVWRRLHLAGACNGEPIEISRGDDNRIMISGIVPTRRRREELVTALEEISDREFIRIDLEAAEDLQPPSSAVSIAPLPALRSRPPVDDSEILRSAAALLRGMYPSDTDDQTRKRLVEISNRAIRESEESIAQAWAVRRLGERFHNLAGLDLSPQSRRLLETTAREHLVALHAHLTELDNSLTPLLPQMASEQALPPPPLELFAAVDRLRVLVQASLLGNSSSQGSPADVTREIAALSKFLSADLSNLDAAVARVFSKPLASTTQ